MALIVNPSDANIIIGGGNNQSSYYPALDDDDFAKKIVEKKEFFINRKRKYYDKNFKNLLGEYLPDPVKHLMPHQKLARSFINPETPYKSCLLFHDTGTGKTLSSIAIAEGFKKHILNLRRTGKSAWVFIIAEQSAQDRFFDELISGRMFGEYANYEEKSEYDTLKKIPENERSPAVSIRLKELKKEFKSRIMNPKKDGIYKFVSFREFQNKTIGRREKQEGRTQYDEDGNVLRINPADEIKTLDNSVIIIDEAHRIESNDWIEAIRVAIRKSKNTRIVLSTATPMYHDANEIVQIINLINPPEMQIKKTDIFDRESDTGIKPDGITKIKEVAKGKILYLRGKDPDLFPEIIQMGDFMPEKLELLESKLPEKFRLKYTKLIRVEMSPFQYETYLDFYDGTLPIEKRMITDIVLPTPKHDKLGGFDKKVISEIANAPEHWKQKHKIDVYRDGLKVQRITGEILEHTNIGKYSPKYKKVLEDLFAARGKCIIYEEFIEGLGINLFLEILVENGYTPIRGPTVVGVSSTSKIKQRCYYCGEQFNMPKFKNSSSHTCSPAYFVLLTGSLESKAEQEQLLSKFNDIKNLNGNEIKIILGSQVIKESIDFKAVRHMFILNYQNNFSSIKQIEGRSARNNSHFDLPKHERNVKIYKYVSSVPGKKKESAEELKYRLQEYEHIIIQKIARAFKEVSIDCYLNKKSNIGEAELKEFKGCETSKNPKKCSPDCDYMDCDYTCDYEPAKPIDQTTVNLDTWFKHEKYEREELIKYIKVLFKLDIVWDIPSIISSVIRSDKFEFINDMTIVDTIHQMVNEKTKLHNAAGASGYFLVVGDYILFQPHGSMENISVEERRLPKKSNEKFYISLSDYISFIIRKGPEGFDQVEYIYKMLETVDTRAEIGKALGTVSVDAQRKLLEISIEHLVNKTILLKSNAKILEKPELHHNIPPSPEILLKIMVNYSDYLITDNQLSKDSDYAKNRFSIDNSYDIPEIKGKKIVGHFFGDTIRCLEDGKWIKCKNPLNVDQKTKLMKENNYIVGYIDKTANGTVVFKLRFVKAPEEDKRKNNKGFICKHHNVKQILLDIAKNIGIEQDLTLKNIGRVCDLIEIKLRNTQYESNKQKFPERYFYEYLEAPDIKK